MTIERYRRRTRRLHTAVYVVTFLLLGSGWWLLAGREGQPTPIATITGISDTALHVWLGWALVAIGIFPLVFAMRGVAGFVRETLRYDRGDLRWLARWPAGALTGRFGHHDGHFDPGQRLANVAIVGLLAILVGSGIGLFVIDAGPMFAIMAAAHRIATVAFTIVIAGHILIAIGVLPGYRGVWRSMHGGRLRLDTARRIWPGWTERQVATGRTTRAAPRSRQRPRPTAVSSRDAPSRTR